ncbi:MAG: caspase domain-containing protein, partial [Rhodobacteraceae bacterium]|nr:caspase domain-containing protein [Paracoccaceae bacterium]
MKHFFCFFFLLLLSLTSAHAERRVALVIGNSGYTNVAELKNPYNDAKGMSDKLTDLGFDVVTGLDLSLRDMRQTVREFIKKLDNADLALFFYAGHGIQVNGENYLVPVDAELSTHLDLDFEALPANLVLNAMEQSTKVNLVFLDACRNNPFTENLARSMGTRSSAVGRGLAKIGSGVGSLVSFATQPGNVALDGDGENSPFTTALIKHLGTPGQDITRDLVMVRRDVL